MIDCVAGCQRVWGFPPLSSMQPTYSAGLGEKYGARTANWSSTMRQNEIKHSTENV